MNPIAGILLIALGKYWRCKLLCAIQESQVMGLGIILDKPGCCSLAYSPNPVCLYFCSKRRTDANYS